jgi:two-component system, OmpR family, response regulator
LDKFCLRHKLNFLQVSIGEAWGVPCEQITFIINAVTKSMTVLTFLPRHDLRNRIGKALSSTGFAVEEAASANDCVGLAEAKEFEGIIFDSDSLIFVDVLALVAFLRQQHSKAALFVVVRYLDLHQRLSLFEAGVDDCVPEPFFASELAVRLALSIRLRQKAFDLAASGAIVLRAGDLEVDLVRRRATRLGKAICLGQKEFLLLEYLVRNVNRPVTRAMIMEHVWDSAFEGSSNVVDVHISTLRSKLDRDFSQKLIQTNRGIGYTLICKPGFTQLQPAVDACSSSLGSAKDVVSSRRKTL